MPYIVLLALLVLKIAYELRCISKALKVLDSITKFNEGVDRYESRSAERNKKRNY